MTDPHPGLRPGSRPPTCLLPEGAFTAAGPDLRGPWKRETSLAGFVQGLLGRSAAEQALEHAVLGPVGPLLRDPRAFRFALEQLVPHLRVVGGQRPRALPRAVARLVERTPDFAKRLRVVLRAEAHDPRLAKVLATPRLLIGRTAIALERTNAPAAEDAGICIDVDGRWHRVLFERALSRGEYLREVEDAQARRVRDAIHGDFQLRAAAKALGVSWRALLSHYQSESRAGYRVFYRDDVHELQYSGGRWQLLRGPVRMRVAEGSIWVAVPVCGRDRRTWMLASPTVTASGRVWRAPGVSVHGILCMGLEQQYEGLLSTSLTDAEALVQWLDAAVVVATERPEFHRRWRARVEPRPRELC